MGKEIKNTAEQQAVLDVENKNIIVSAQAGAGKTRVLVQKIVDYIIEDHVGLDRMLIVTFTKKAANEMKDRIREKLVQALQEENQDREWIYRQLNNVASANISTMHAFCLQVLQEHFELIGRDPGFHVLNERSLAQLEQEAMDQVLEEVYQSQEEELVNFLEVYGFSNRRDDGPLRSLIQSLYNIGRNQIFSRQWLEEELDRIGSESYNQETYDLWLEEKIGSALVDLAFSMQLYEDFLLDPIMFEKLEGFVLADLDQLAGSFFEPVLSYQDKNLDTETIRRHEKELSKVWENLPDKLSLKRLSGISKKSNSEEELGLKDQVRDFRNNLKEKANDLILAIKALSLEDIAKENKKMRADLGILAGLTLKYADTYQALKEEKNGMDFSDIEHEMVVLLENETVQRELQDRYVYIFFDEYQDASEVQNYIVEKIRREDNLFFVGDIKQSIYGFRLAEPENFMDRYDSYKKETDLNAALDLTANFRSLPPILDFVNFVFNPLMTKRRSGIDFDSSTHRSNAKLEDDKDQAQVEFVILEEPKEDEEDDEKSSSLDEISSQAFYVAHKIQDLVRQGACYGDFAILFRTKHRIYQYERILEAFNIPYYSDSKSVEMDAMEVQVFLQVLQVIDNGQVDVSLLSVLTSIVGQFSDEDLAKIRIQQKDQAFSQAMKDYKIEEDDSDSQRIRQKIDDFYGKIENWRRELKQSQLSDFIWKVLLESGIYSFVSSLADGEERRENLNAILRMAADYESEANPSLPGFLAYVKMDQKGAGIETPTASDLSEKDNVVRLMSIHKSKGLEFPIVFMVELERKFSNAVSKETLSFHKDLGIALKRKYVEEESGLIVKGDPKRLILVKDRIGQDDLAEEMRVLYVGMTRAEKQLYLLGQSKDMEKTFQSLRGDLEKLLDEGNSYQDWILSTLAKDAIFQEKLQASSNFNLDLPEAEKDFYRLRKGEDSSKLCIILEEGKTYRTIDQVLGLDTEEKLDFDPSGLVGIFDYQYPYREETEEPIKNTVSEISKKNQVPMDDHYKAWPTYQGLSKGLLGERKPPLFMQDQVQISPAEWGTRMHFALQLLPLENYDEESLKQAIDQLVDRDLFTPEERQSLDESMLLALFQSDLGQDIIANKESVVREAAFTLVYEKIGQAGRPIQINIDGQIDLFYEKEGMIEIVDFKTDQRPDPKKYQTQMEFYKEALDKAYPHKKVVAISLYWVRHQSVSRLEF